MFNNLLQKVKTSRPAAFITAMFMAVMVPSLAHADLADVIKTPVEGIVTDVTAAAGVVVLVVVAVVGAKVVFGLLKKA